MVDEPFLDDLFVALSDPHRRQLLFALVDQTSLPRSELIVADAVSFEWEGDDQHHISMIHTHLPMLEEMELIEWDRRHHEVVPGPRFNDVEPILSALNEQQDKLIGWSTE